MQWESSWKYICVVHFFPFVSIALESLWILTWALVSYPSRWSLSFIIGPLHWSSPPSRQKRNIPHLCAAPRSDRAPPPRQPCHAGPWRSLWDAGKPRAKIWKGAWTWNHLVICIWPNICVPGVYCSLRNCSYRCCGWHNHSQRTSLKVCQCHQFTKSLSPRGKLP